MKFEKVDLFCPKCGKYSVVVDQDSDDYYQGKFYKCESCDLSFNTTDLGEFIYDNDPIENQNKSYFQSIKETIKMK